MGGAKFSFRLMVLLHLKSPAQFRAILACAPIARTVHFFLYRMTDASTMASAIGVVLPKRCAKRAVTRNMLRRQVYAMSAMLESQWVPASYVVRLRQGFADGGFLSATSKNLKHQVRAELETLFQSAVKPC